MKLPTLIPTLFAISLLLTSCSGKDKTDDEGHTDETETAFFAKGADVGWLTEMESEGRKFYNSAGKQTECMYLLKSLGMNSVRLRVWVDPAGGWCSKTDVLNKALRAKSLGLKIMIDFHYSDSWADPGKQNKPAAWVNYNIDQLVEAVGMHTREVLNLLKDNNVDVDWIQVGNETTNGMLWEEGRASTNMAQYARLNNAGYDAAKELFPTAKVIVQIDNGYDNDRFRWIFDGLRSNGGKWDVIGMSLYPTADNWSELVGKCMINVGDMIGRYGSEVMICEVGMAYDKPNDSKAFLQTLIRRCKAVEANKCLGVFYWEPECYNWRNYSKGAFDDSGRPTVALDAFAD